MPVRVYGLTGGIASGKSTVSRMLRDMGAHVIDADVLAREAVAPGEPAVAEIAARFPGVVDATGAVDRSALSARVFRDPGEREALERIVHPRIQARFQALRQALASQGVPFLVYDAALIVEKNLHRNMDGLIVVSAPDAVQTERLLARDGLSRAEAEARIAAQLPLARKLAAARWIVDNSGSLDATRAQVARIHAEMTQEAGGG